MIFGTQKILRYPERLADYQQGKPVAPVTLEFDLTTACQHKCPQCGGGRPEGLKFFDDEDARGVLVDCYSEGVKGVMFTGGGEPLCHPDCVDLIEFAHGLGLDVGFITNGGFLTKETSKRLLKVCQWIRVSVDASDSRMYQRTHGVGELEWAKLWDNLWDLQGQRQDSPCTVGLGYLVDAETKRGMHTATQDARTLFAHDEKDSYPSYIQFRPYHWDFTPIDDVLPLCKQYETETFKVLCSEQKYAHFGTPPWRDYDYCHGAHFGAVIQADGNVPLCCHLRGKPAFYIGNVHKQSFQEIWEGERKRTMLKMLDVSKCMPFCRNDSFNRVLHDVVTEKEHEAFL